MPTSEQFQIRAIVRSLDRVTERAIQKITHDITANLSVPARGSTTGTPVDTGWARANWIPSIGDSVDEPVGTPESPGAADQAKQRGLADVLRYRLRRGKCIHFQ